jgi:hypothetical protein
MSDNQSSSTETSDLPDAFAAVALIVIVVGCVAFWLGSMPS